MTAVKALKELKKFTEKEVASKIRLQKEAPTTKEPEYVNPVVALMTLPHKNFMPTNFQVPHILIGLSSGNDATDEHTISIQMQFATFGGDMQFEEDANIPDSSGYIDLLNLMELTKEKLVKSSVINGCGVIDKPILYGVYNEQITYPYWYGYMTFDLQIQITNPQLKNIL